MLQTGSEGEVSCFGGSFASAEVDSPKDSGIVAAEVLVFETGFTGGAL